MLKYGLKLWSTNKHLFQKAATFHKKGLFDFIELYIVPDTIQNDDLDILKGIPVQIHAPHSFHNFNLYELNKEKIDLFKNQIIKTANFLNAKYIILHPGINNDFKGFKENVAQIYDKRILIENMPDTALDGSKVHFGCSLEHLNFIKKECGFDICFDFEHALVGIISKNLNYKDYLKSLISELSPYYFHISGNNENIPIDTHKNLWESCFDIKWTKKLLNELSAKKDIFLVFEVPKANDNLENDIKNMDYFRKIS